MNYVFFGTPEFGRIVLEKLLDADSIPLALVTNPDKPVGRKQALTYSPTKQLIFDKKLDERVVILQPQKINEGFLEKLRTLNADLFIIAAFLWEVSLAFIPPFFRSIAVHPLFSLRF